MLKAVLHALASSDHTYDPFLAVLVLPVWDDSPWTSVAIKGHPNMPTRLIRIPNGHMRFVPADKQTDDPSMVLKPAKWPVQLVLIANAKGRETYLDAERINNILSLAIQAICRLTPTEKTFFPPSPHPRCTTTLRTPTCPKRSLPHIPAIGTMISPRGPSTPLRAP